MASTESLGSLEKAIEILYHLHTEPAGVGVTAIGRALDMPKSSVHRLLAALVRRSLVERDARGHYRTGIGLVALGLGALEREPVLAAARPVLEAEAAALDETVFLVAARAGRLLVLDKAEGTGFLRASPRVGAEVPVHATAVGKLFLAFGDGCVSLPEGELERFTEQTRAVPEELARDVRRAREQGFAVNREEWIPGLAVVAAPVMASGRLQAAVALASSAQRLEALGSGELARRMLAAGERIGARLAGTDDG
ncbi:MAG: IclR family transcriptional regulator [Deltaproteobacteria bacterium]|nr:IclR family transcriptional regulator [Deltaproteobacteria bacterium]MBW2359947.1 IclR family transcriptional regulator [Deltaproteobacteria bacterium]